MTFRASALVIIASLALFACYPSQTSSAADECNPNQCTIMVKVVNNCSTANDITVNIPVMKVPKANKHIEMNWELETANFKFAKEPVGITIKPNPPPPSGEFTQLNAHANDTKFKLKNANSDTPGGTPINYNYGIQLLRADGSSCPFKDPVIRNGS